MGVWDAYGARLNSQGRTLREDRLNRERSYIEGKWRDSLSYHAAEIDGVNRELVIVNSDNLNEKTVFSTRNDDFDLGSMIHWMDNWWIVTEVDPNTEIYMRGKLVQCNYLLRYIAYDGSIQEQWTVIEDGTKLACRILACWFGALETVRKNCPLNCWNILRAA